MKMAFHIVVLEEAGIKAPTIFFGFLRVSEPIVKSTVRNSVLL